MVAYLASVNFKSIPTVGVGEPPGMFKSPSRARPSLSPAQYIPLRQSVGKTSGIY